MSDKKDQQKTIEEIKEFLRNFGWNAFEQLTKHYKLLRKRNIKNIRNF